MTTLLSLLLLSFLALTCQCFGDERKVHIVYMGSRHSTKDSSASSSPSSTHHAMLTNVLSSDISSSDSIVYSYERSFNGFAARLTDEEVEKLSAEMDEVVSVMPNLKFQTHTTRSWDFMGLTSNLSLGFPTQRNVIVGVIDTGIWPESESFQDDDVLVSPPLKWKGKCDTGGTNFTCNNKLIGARFYNADKDFSPLEFKSPRDAIGHGTHTSSTAAGRQVSDASYFGLAEGIARGAVPEARIAMYKVCWLNYGCSSADILAAFDDAIADGVDIISVSLGTGRPLQYFEDPIAIGSFHAMKAGILTSNSAGNSGPFPITVANYAPWSLTVAASSIDRKFVSNVVLGNGKTYVGIAVNSFNLGNSVFPLISGGDAVNVSAGSSPFISSYCLDGAMNTQKVEGKLVLCNGLYGEEGIPNANGLGVILSSDRFRDVARNYRSPVTVVSNEDAQEILEYIKTSSNPVAVIEVSDQWTDPLAPTVVSFSSRGPNPITPDILKPDLTAPGVDILAAWSPAASPTFNPEEDKRRVKFNIISGTSMSCPHVSGAAAYLKSAHPNWSPAAIKSALMTTAIPMDPRKNEDAEFAYGSGHISPVRAVNPGLIFDASVQDYITFLCKQGYNTSTLRRVIGDNCTCNGVGPGKVWDLNYPSFSLSVPDGGFAAGTFYRTVTNVGFSKSTYYATIYEPENLKISVEPSKLSFSQIGEKKSFVVKVNGGLLFQQPIISAHITWFDGVHSVRTPLVVFTTILPVNLNQESTELTSISKASFPRLTKRNLMGN
ncbi:hypothetical protein J5N97_029242 [Dioscorea zingiberensis]|uniref:Cucumisin n=1 Tax=Dioscorea zingiberensis TaxID=325984 RepID=A0A9D5C0K0_9LILI|nr:hypothetical protein J5N97_029242 [Dioscorea zingiberensis]